ncbi:FtsQ-type POTRA domain-containing protein [Metabacillus sp. GX 13764]|uniref:cell division protein FtsQ/DivIB n=1 Tax=Metabacillus kandeliae TaxID=2900151 RepID=UPI001E613A29|nr:FtsQ-type POTRA domain-containing protein [Metabacillus kandeliae]MCD7033889.1 FtsQ-type POTRA domain-containing protein [Metabacillus kandeliae]
MKTKDGRENIIPIDERIPKLKEQRKQKTNKRLIFFLSVFFVLLLLVIYFQSPLSKVNEVNVKGNKYVSSEEIIKLSGITANTGFWNIQDDKVFSNVSKQKEIKSIRILKSFPNKVTIAVEEYERIAYAEKSGHYYPVLENGQVLGSVSDHFPSDAPLLMNWKNAEQLQEMGAELSKLPEGIINSISEISFQPEKTDQNHLELYMTEGYEVSASMENFADKMLSYPAVIKQLSPGAKGIIHMEVGTYFESFDKKDEDKKEGEKNEAER